MMGRAEIERLLPQKAAMCLVDTVLETTRDGIVCTADASRDGHPLRERQGVSVVHAIEYGAQAAALHRLLTGREAFVPGGLLLQVKNAKFHAQWLDRLPQPLRVTASCLVASSEAASYRFEVRAGDTVAASGDLTLKLS
jgi:predicted hotdog family 3-hydroxylacyl-ACP dehydratase